MKQILVLAAALLLAVSCSQKKAPKILVLYYSQTNTTKVVAEEMAVQFLQLWPLPFVRIWIVRKAQLRQILGVLHRAVAVLGENATGHPETLGFSINAMGIKV